MMIGRSSDSRRRRAIARPSSSGSLRSRITRSTTSAASTRSMSAPVSATDTLKSFSVRYSRMRSRIATSSSTTRIWASNWASDIVVWGILNPKGLRIRRDAAMNATTTRLPATYPLRRTLSLVAFGVVYYALAAYAASLPLHQRIPLFIWPAHGLALGTLLVVAPRQWPAFLALIVAATLGVGFTSSAPWSATIVTAIVNAAQPLLVAAGLQRLAGPRVQIDTVKGLASFLIGMLPLVAAISILDASYSYLRFDAPFRERWSVTFVSTLLGMLVLSPLLLAWSRPGYEDAMGEARVRMPELVVLYLGLMFTTAWVFSTRPQGGGFVPPLAYLCAPFLIWAALRFGLRAATLGLAMFGLIAYWYTGTGITNFAVPGGAPDIKALLNLQAFLATIVITTLFSAALHVEREEATRETQAWRHRHERVIRASASLLYEFDPVGGQVVWDGDTRSV